MTTTVSSLSSDKGFLLSRHSFDRRTSGKSEIHLWVSTIRGPAKLVIENESPVFFIERDDVEKVTASINLSSIQCSYKELNLKTFTQADITGVYFNSLREFYDARSILDNSNISFYEGGIRLEERFLMERFIYAGVEFIGEESSLKEQEKKGFREYRNVKVKPSNFVPDFRTLSLDIECSEKGELYSIGFYASNFKQVIMIQPDALSNEESAADFIHWVNNEHELLKALERTIQEYDPDIIIGWNVINFDFRLLAERANLYHLKLKLGRDNSFMRWRDSHTEKNQGFISIDGRVVIDGIAALKAEAYSFPSFSLEAIGQHFLGRGKATDDVDNRLKAIMDDFNHNKVKLAEYNLQDCILVWDIFEKINLLDYLIFRSQLTGLELDRAGGSVAAFVNLYLPKLTRRWRPSKSRWLCDEFKAWAL
jgi:DNA polymerase-2